MFYGECLCQKILWSEKMFNQCNDCENTLLYIYVRVKIDGDDDDYCDILMN